MIDCFSFDGAGKGIETSGEGCEVVRALFRHTNLYEFLYLQRQKIEKEKTQFKLTIDKLPTRPEVNPSTKMIDPISGDKILKVETR
jgi:hypothetical protein